MAQGYGNCSGCPKGHLDGQAPLREELAEGIVFCVLLYYVLCIEHCALYCLLCTVYCAPCPLGLCYCAVASGVWASPTTPFIPFENIINHLEKRMWVHWLECKHYSIGFILCSMWQDGYASTTPFSPQQKNMFCMGGREWKAPTKQLTTLYNRILSLKKRRWWAHYRRE